jgi:sugar phosphate permease
MEQGEGAGSSGRSRGGFLGDLRGQALWVVAGGLICQFALGFGYVFHPLAGDILAEFGWTRTQLSAAQAPQLWVISLASPVVGALVLRLGARAVLVSSTLLVAVGYFDFSQIQALWQYAALTIVLGLAVVGAGDITVGQLVTRWVRESRGLALGIVYTGSNLAGFALVRYVVFVADRQSWRMALAHLSVFALVVLFPVALWLVRDRPADGSSASPTASSSELERTSAPEGAQAGEDRDLPLSGALRTRSFWILLFGIFCFFFYFLGILHHLVLLLTGQGLARDVAAGYLSSAIGLGIVSKVLLGLVADRIHHRTAILLDFALLAFSSICLLWVPEPTFLWLFVLSYGFASAARDVVYPLIIIECFGLRYLAPIYGALMLAMAPGGSLGPLIAANLYDRYGSYQAALYLFVALNAASLLSLFLVRDERRAGE